MGIPIMELVYLFYIIDEFCKEFEPKYGATKLEADGDKHVRIRSRSLSLSEIMTIIVHFHQSNHRNFKHYYKDYVMVYLRSDFPKLVSYNRFIELMSETSIPMASLLVSMMSTPTTANYIDSTKIVVCHNRRIRRNKVFKGLAARGMSSMGWFYGFKLHLICNERGELTSFMMTPGNTSDSSVPVVATLARKMYGKLFGDRGYISKDLFTALWGNGVHLITGIRRNMKNKLMNTMDKVMLRGRSIIETINDQLKNQEQIEHTRHRSPINFGVNLLSGLIAYQLQPKKPCLDFSQTSGILSTQLLLDMA
jgi:Transposase DDE domain